MSVIPPLWYSSLPQAVIISKSAFYKLDPMLVSAIVHMESRGNGWAVRYEPGAEKDISRVYPQLAMSAGVSIETEKQCEMFSWGHMQVMGWVARGLGYTGPLSRLCEADVGIEYGCKLLAGLTERFGPNEADIIAAYNAGSPRRGADGQYVNSVYVAAVQVWLAQIRPIH